MFVLTSVTAVSETSLSYVILHVCACVCMSTGTHAHTCTAHMHMHFLGTLLSNHFFKEEGKTTFNFTELTRRDNEVLSKLFMCGSPRGKPQSFLTFSNQLLQKKRVSPIMKYTNADCTDSISQSVLERQHSHN